MPRHFSIDLGPSGQNLDDVLTFDLRGVVDGEEWTETFEALPAMPVGVLADLGGWTFPASKSVEFVAGLLTPESEERFRELVHDKKRIVRDVDLADLVRRLLVEYSGRPTMPPSGSSNGATTTGTTSTGG